MSRAVQIVPEQPLPACTAVQLTLMVTWQRKAACWEGLCCLVGSRVTSHCVLVSSRSHKVVN